MYSDICRAPGSLVSPVRKKDRKVRQPSEFNTLDAIWRPSRGEGGEISAQSWPCDFKADTVSSSALAHAGEGSTTPTNQKVRKCCLKTLGPE